MTPLARALSALPFTFAIYVLEATLATLFALPLGLELLGQLRTTAWDGSQVALLLDSAETLAPALRTGGGSLLLSAGLAFVLGPWLQMSWLSSLANAGGALPALWQGTRRLVRAWWVSLLVLLCAVILCAPFALIGYAVHSGLAASTDARFHDLAVLGALSPLLLVLPFVCLLHDLARASALERTAARAVLRGFRSALGVRVQLRMLGLTTLGYGAVLLAQWLALRLSGVPLSFVLTVGLLQSALLARTFLRSLWLASALTCVADEHEPVVAHTANERAA
jgi:hypothetical protein